MGEAADQVYTSVKTKVNQCINNVEFLTLICDEWTSIVQDHWVNYILATPKP
ncbi:13136_t:CDS:2, partial [Cetraspora pellucida]